MEEMVRRVERLLLPPIIKSRWMETEPLEVIGQQPWYLNCIVSGSYRGAARDLLMECQAIEDALGRVRSRYHGPRTADVDILLFGNVTVHEEGLSLPHPGLLRRRFCLEGINEIDPELILPGKRTRIRDYCATLEDSIAQQKIDCYGAMRQGAPVA